MVVLLLLTLFLSLLFSFSSSFFSLEDSCLDLILLSALIFLLVLAEVTPEDEAAVTADVEEAVAVSLTTFSDPASFFSLLWC